MNEYLKNKGKYYKILIVLFIHQQPTTRSYIPIKLLLIQTN